MIANCAIEPHKVKDITALCGDIGNGGPLFPLAIIDYDSYIVSSEIQSGINDDKEQIAHNLQIGKYCSLADKIKFMIGLNHDYKNVATGACSFLEDVKLPCTLKQKNQIIIQNDVWVGSGATIMSGVTIHNGAVVASDSHVIHDVPPYAIVGGNPAKIIKFRFNEDQIKKMLKISWWNWDIEKLNNNKMMFAKSIDEFIETFYECSLTPIPLLSYPKTKPICLFFPDLGDIYSVTEHVIKNYCQRYGDSGEVQLLIILNTSDDINHINDILNKINLILRNLKCEGNNNIIIHIDNLTDEKPLFQIADYYVTTRAKETVRRACYADEFAVKIISGVDRPVFDN